MSSNCSIHLNSLIAGVFIKRLPYSFIVRHSAFSIDQVCRCCAEQSFHNLNKKIICQTESEMENSRGTGTLSVFFSLVRRTGKKYQLTYLQNSLISFVQFKLQNCCTLSRIVRYKPQDVIYKEDVGRLNSVFIVLNGTCTISQRLRMKVSIYLYK